MKKFNILSFLALFIALFLTACQSKTEKKNEKTNKNIIIAVIPKIDNVIFEQVKESSMKAAKELGITVTWEAPTSISVEKQQELIENLIKYKVDGILISCNDAELLQEPINKAVRAGIKVATFDSDCPNSSRSFYIGTDNKNAGRICAETMQKLYQNSKQKPGMVAVLSGGISANNLDERLKGFKAEWGCKNISEVLYSYEQVDYGNELLTFHLQNNKQVNGIQMLWGVPALAGVDSIPVLNSFINNGGKAVFFDVSRALLMYIKKHPENTATVKQDFRAMGYNGIMNLYDAIMGKPVKIQILYDVKVIDKTNVDIELKRM